ncbi:uncharacterized protein LOC110744346 [Prunus avium]|uniref:Uncharacterized protein LOC110744346 n=1 Tax=Prunus avium TaxID=42229 RepID=A0A6P5R4U4_PRUAV|nr:uncharacterized protein LOC110744346 [Prunus avium]
MTEHRNRELVFLILRFLEEQKYDDAVHRLEKDSGYFFNMRYFEDCVIHGEWDEVEHYLAGFTKVDENSDSTKILFAIRKQKFLEALDRHDHAKAVQILQRDLEPLLTFGDEFYDEVSSLFLPVVICREKERISKCDDARSTRAALLSKIKMLIDASPLFHDKLQFPNFDHSRLRTLLKQSYSDTSIYETVRSEVRRAISEIQNDLESAMRRSITPALATTDIADTPPDLVNPSAVELVLDIRREYAKKLEQAMRRSITPALATTDIADTPPDLVNPSAVELVLDIRREYAKKLEQSLERSRKLQSDLAVEEHRGQELSRILKELLPDPKTSNVPKSRPGRKVGASSSALGTNNQVLKLEVLVIGEHDTFRFVREAISRAVLDMSSLETSLDFHYSYEDTPFMVSCDALERPNIIVMEHRFVVQLGRAKMKILVDGWRGKKWGPGVDLMVVTVVWAGHVEDEELNAWREQRKQGGKIASPFPGLIDAVFLGEHLDDIEEIAPLLWSCFDFARERKDKESC